jgi:cbb3-type cytochrome oxidase maturation protein
MYVLLPAALLFAVVAAAVFAWAARSGQFDDLETPAMRVIGDDDEITGAEGGALPHEARASGSGRVPDRPVLSSRGPESPDSRDENVS